MTTSEGEEIVWDVGEIMTALAENDADIDTLIDVWSDQGIEQGEWGGVPWLDTDATLTLEPGYPFQGLNGMSLEILHQNRLRKRAIRLSAYYAWEAAGRPMEPEQAKMFWFFAEAEHDLAKAREQDDESLDFTWEPVNQWFSRNCQRDIIIWRHKFTDKRKFTIEPTNWVSRLNFVLNTLDVSKSWSLKAEFKAMEKLRRHVADAQFRQYILTGSFMEQSEKSRLDYMFRKCRPTLVFSSSPEEYRLIIALCSHTTGYYMGTWAGVLTPTDEVLAHLLRMRHDEYNFWKKSNHHPPYSELAGV